MDFGLSSGEDSESEEDESPEGLTAAVLEDRLSRVGRAGLFLQCPSSDHQRDSLSLCEKEAEERACDSY